VTVHILKYGLPVCLFSREVPGNWPEGHKWIGFDDSDIKAYGDVITPSALDTYGHPSISFGSTYAALSNGGRNTYRPLDQNLFTVTSHTFVGNLFTAAGMVDVADRAGNSSDYPQLNAETLLSSNPDLIFLADTKCCGQSAATVSARPGYSTIAAVKNGRVVALDDDIASRWGPRVTDLLSKIVDADRSVPVS